MCNIKLNFGLLIVGLALLGFSQISSAQQSSLTLGAKLQLSNWEGSNDQAIGEDFDTTGNQIGLSLTYQSGRFYLGLNLQGGEYDFDNGAPNKNNGSAPPIATNDVTIGRGESDLLIGYYFWERVSLFFDLKQVTNDWQDQGYSLRYRGLGIGISGYYPLDPQWNLYGSFGVVPLNIWAAGNDIGDGTGSALEFGTLYRVNENTNINLSIKNQSQTYEFSNGDKQTHTIGGLLIGVTHRFPL